MDDVDVVTTVCSLLGAAGVGQWRPSGPAYTATETGVFYGAIPPAPDRAVGVALYMTDDDLETGLQVRRVQVRVRGSRGSPQDADVLADAAFKALQRMSRTAGLNLTFRVASARLGADANSRQERADSYQIIIDNSEA